MDTSAAFNRAQLKLAVWKVISRRKVAGEAAIPAAAPVVPAPPSIDTDEEFLGNFTGVAHSPSSYADAAKWKTWDDAYKGMGVDLGTLSKKYPGAPIDDSLRAKLFQEALNRTHSRPLEFGTSKDAANQHIASMLASSQLTKDIPLYGGKTPTAYLQERGNARGEWFKTQKDPALAGKAWGETLSDLEVLPVGSKGKRGLKDLNALGINQTAIIQYQILSAGKEGLAETRARIAEMSKNPSGTGWGDFAKNNWQALMVPLGMVSFLFGGNVGKVLGVMAMGFGGYNLYNRYKNLTSDAAKPIVAAGLQYKKDGKPAPFDEEWLSKLSPQQQEIARDFSHVTRWGLAEKQIDEGVVSGVTSAVSGLSGLPAEQVRKYINPAPVAPPVVAAKP